jgi:hypothetical protein
MSFLETSAFWPRASLCISSEFLASLAESNEESAPLWLREEDWLREGWDEFVDGRCFIIYFLISASSSLVFSSRFSLGFSDSGLTNPRFCLKISAKDF